MKTLIAIDSFKGSLDSVTAGYAVAAGFKQAMPDIENTVVPIADGGEGSFRAIQSALGGQLIEVQTIGPLRDPVIANYLMTRYQEVVTAVIEVAQVVGIQLINRTPENALKSSTFGLAKVVKDAIKRGAKRIILTLGGSGTTDGGLGLLAGLGAEIKDSHGDLVNTGNYLNQIASINLQPAKQMLSGIDLIGAVDVQNAFFGKDGPAIIFGPQKGLSPELVGRFDQQLRLTAQRTKMPRVPGNGAAGGLGGAITLLGGRLEGGFTLISTVVDLEELIREADLVITGEGSLDSQSNMGKVPFGVAKIAKQFGKPTIALCGRRAEDLGELGKLLVSAYSIQMGPISTESAMKPRRTAKNLINTAEQVMNTVMVFSRKLVKENSVNR